VIHVCVPRDLHARTVFYVLCVCYARSTCVHACLDVCTNIGMLGADVMRASLRVAMYLCYGGSASCACARLCFACVLRVIGVL
jgi:hypothetical protein